MSQTEIKPQKESEAALVLETLDVSVPRESEASGLMAQRLRLLWEERRVLVRTAASGLVLGVLLAFLIPKRYDSTTQLMPPDSQSNTGMAIMTALAARGGGFGTLAGDMLGIKSSGALFIGILRSRTVEDRLIETFNLKKDCAAGTTECILTLFLTKSVHDAAIAPAGNFIYYDGYYHDLSTNKGQLIANPVGRDGKAYQAWTRFWVGARTHLEFSYRHAQVSPKFVPDGGTINDASVRSDYWLHKVWNVHASVRYEQWTFPILAHGPQTNVTSSVGITFAPVGGHL
jgi:hypothetical protein